MTILLNPPNMPQWAGQLTGAQWAASQEYLQLWQTLPSRWMLPFPELGDDPAGTDWQLRGRDLLPDRLNQTCSERFLELIDRAYWVKTLDQSAGWPVVTDDSTPHQWDWMPPIYVSKQTYSRLLTAVAQAAQMATPVRIMVLANSWEAPLLDQATQPFGLIEPPVLNRSDKMAINIILTWNQTNPHN